MTENERILIDGFRAARRWLDQDANEHFVLSDDDWAVESTSAKWSPAYVAEMNAIRAASKLVGR